MLVTKQWDTMASDTLRGYSVVFGLNLIGLLVSARKFEKKEGSELSGTRRLRSPWIGIGM